MNINNIDHAAIAKGCGLSESEMKARFGNPGETSPEDIANALGLSDAKRDEIFGTEPIEEGDSFELTDEGLSAYFESDGDVVEDTEDNKNPDKVRDYRIKEVADATGIDKESVANIMRRLEDGSYSGYDPEVLVAKLVSKTGLSEYEVGTVLNELL